MADFSRGCSVKEDMLMPEGSHRVRRLGNGQAFGRRDWRIWSGSGTELFFMAAREENITRAASLLHVTQPTLSRQLMQLEEELGVKLFERSSHSIILTDEGMLLAAPGTGAAPACGENKKGRFPRGGEHYR